VLHGKNLSFSSFDLCSFFIGAEGETNHSAACFWTCSRCHHHRTMGCSNSARPPPKDDTDIFDDLWNSITDPASEFTRLSVRPCFIAIITEPPTLMPRADVLSVFAEPGILRPNIITFHLDRDVAGIVGPFRFISKGWRNLPSAPRTRDDVSVRNTS